MKFDITRDEYRKLAEKYESNDEVRRLVVFTHEGTKALYFGRGFIRGMTFGMILSLAVALIVSTFV